MFKGDMLQHTSSVGLRCMVNPMHSSTSNIKFNSVHIFIILNYMLNGGDAAMYRVDHEPESLLTLLFLYRIFISINLFRCKSSKYSFQTIGTSLAM